MIPAGLKRPLRHMTVVALGVSFPLLYMSAVGLESVGLTAAALAMTGFAALLAALVY